MKIFLLYILLFITAVASAQKKPKTIQLDTIHIRGYIYDEFGNPVNGLQINAKGPKVKIPDGYHLDDYDYNTTTDASGFFMLKGARFNDTLKLGNNSPGLGSSSIYNTSVPIYNRGSRYLIITLAHKKVENIDSSNTIQIKSVRTRTKVNTQLKLVPNANTSVGVFAVYQSMAKPKGGIKRFTDTITSRIIYPKKAIDNNIEGEVKILFIVEKDGTVIKPRILQGIGYGCDEEVMNAILKSPKWVPAIEVGRPTVAQEIITVDFELIDK